MLPLTSGENHRDFRSSSEDLSHAAICRLYWLTQQAEEMTDSTATPSHVEGKQALQVTLQILSIRHRLQTPPLQLILFAGALPKWWRLSGNFDHQ